MKQCLNVKFAFFIMLTYFEKCMKRVRSKNYMHAYVKEKYIEILNFVVFIVCLSSKIAKISQNYTPTKKKNNKKLNQKSAIRYIQIMLLNYVFKICNELHGVKFFY